MHARIYYVIMRALLAESALRKLFCRVFAGKAFLSFSLADRVLAIVKARAELMNLQLPTIK